MSCGPVRYNGIDRKNSNVGYTAANCVPACRRCNLAKREDSVSEFVGWIERAYAHTRANAVKDDDNYVDVEEAA